MNDTKPTEVVTVDLRPYIAPGANLLGAIIIAASILISGGTGGTGTTRGTTTTTPPAAVDPGTVEVTAGYTTIDDDPVKGNLDTATVAIVEFSDYECPFCQSFWQTTLPQIISNYVDSGEVVFVYKDLPLSFHEPGASRAANAAECVRDQLDDNAYFAMHDFIFTQTPTNNSAGVPVDELVAQGVTLGANGDRLKTCIESQEFSGEIGNDSLAASAAGINGTPGFIVGVLDADGGVTGEVVSGAQPFSTFQAVLAKYL